MEMRFSAIPEKSDEDIRKRVCWGTDRGWFLLLFFDWEKKTLENDIDKGYCINPYFARNVPRDVFIHFVKKKTRNFAIALSLKIDNLDNIILKEIHINILICLQVTHIKKDTKYLTCKGFGERIRFSKTNFFSTKINGIVLYVNPLYMSMEI